MAYSPLALARSLPQPSLLTSSMTSSTCGSDSVSRPAVSPDAGSPPAAATHSAFSSVTPVSVAAGVAAGGGGGGSLQTPSPPGLVLGAYPRVPGITDNLYNTAYAAQGYMPFGADPAAFYSPIMTPDQSDALRALPPYGAYDPAMTYPGYGQMNLYAGTNRKNVTRETTNTLKAWLREHIKNPYPTKGEKIMLAIITKMTLTQISTWFANARRRLKKENKMTWTPRNGSESVDEDEADKKDDDDDDDELLDVDGDDDDINPSLPTALVASASSPKSSCSASPPPVGHCDVTSAAKEVDLDSTKPRIWSLADIATSVTPQPPKPFLPQRIVPNLRHF